MSEDLLDRFKRYAERGNYYELNRLRPEFGPPTQWTPGTLHQFIGADLAIGRMDRVITDCLDNQVAAHMPHGGKAILLHSLLSGGVSRLLVEGRIPINAGENEPDALIYTAGCLTQAGVPERAVRLMVRLAQNRPADWYLRRFLVAAYMAAAPNATFETLVRDLRGAGLAVPAEWLAYETLRYKPGSVPVARLPVPGETVIQRGKHIASPYIAPGDRCALPTLDGIEAFTAPLREIPGDLAERVAAFREGASACLDDPEIAAMREALTAVRAAHAPDAGDPIQVISTGRAGTTALFRFLEHSDYLAFHSFGWQTAPRHRWATVARLLNGDVSREALVATVKMYLQCRVAEFAAAYRRNKTPVVVSHWDTIFAPFLSVLFEAPRFVYLRRGERSVIRSMIAKRQYGGTQIAAFPYVRREEAGRDAYLFDVAALDETPFHVGWYLAFTEKFWHALDATCPGACVAAIDSESLFEGEPAGIARLLETFDGLKADHDVAVKHFAPKINEKSMRQTEETDLIREMLADAESAYTALSA